MIYSFISLRTIPPSAMTLLDNIPVSIRLSVDREKNANKEKYANSRDESRRKIESEQTSLP